MTPADLLQAVRMLATSANVVALDVVEVSPPYDHAEQTINNAHRVIFETLAGIASKRMLGRQANNGNSGLQPFG